ncbi:MAG: carbon storage regulator CsrA [Desulfosalsimonas sp.]|uniref:carbon storage regulator CsrA n=1 Tax=Desulfosalsimonas sp. TaxID=3073848 RepID=UPI00397096E6
MLVLTRRAGEGIIIGDDVKVTILESQDGKIRIGIEAPRDRKIYRQEVYDRICRENREASQWDAEKRDILEAVLLKKEAGN